MYRFAGVDARTLIRKKKRAVMIDDIFLQGFVPW